jgi:tungstate transport system substrate-binding protein
LLLLPGCDDEQGEASAKGGATLRLATTTSTVESGLLDELISAFEEEFDVKVEVLAKGSGAAIQLAREGGADVLLAHAPEAENKLVVEGYGVNRREVMYNDFVILGPSDDPARLSGKRDAVAALKQLADRQAPFFSRGDGSGTHMREQELWSLSGIEPSGDWYRSSQSGMLETLEQASVGKTYVLSDRSTYLCHREKLDLVVLVEGDKRLFNSYGVTAVNPLRVSGVHFETAMRFVDFITSADGQAIIRHYGEDRFGMALFTPLAMRE